MELLFQRICKSELKLKFSVLVDLLEKFDSNINSIIAIFYKSATNLPKFLLAFELLFQSQLKKKYYHNECFGSIKYRVVIIKVFLFGAVLSIVEGMTRMKPKSVHLLFEKRVEEWNKTVATISTNRWRYGDKIKKHYFLEHVEISKVGYFICYCSKNSDKSSNFIRIKLS